MNAVQKQQERELVLQDIGKDILVNARNELYLNMRFLDVSLSSLLLQADSGIRLLATDGQVLKYHPEELVSLFRKGREWINHACLHSIFHCLFCHIWNRNKRDEEYWNLACDITTEYLIDSLGIRAIHVAKNTFRRSVYRKIEEGAHVVTAQWVYRFLCLLYPAQNYLDNLKREFTVDDHSLWEKEQKNARSQPRHQKWEDRRERMQTEIEAFSKEASDDIRSLTEQVQAENRERYDYKEFLRKFSVLKEEMKVDMDSFDYIFYHYGMDLYGNMPLIEPLETKEVKRVEDFVIVIDTSMSCKAELVRLFLEQTYAVLSESESFFRKINIHIIQCDDCIQEDVKITGQKELQRYLEHFEAKGFGGTDFRPAFAYVDQLVQSQSFERLRGLIYFTDGYGIFPTRKPAYETAFVFMKQDYRDVDVPPWAIKLIIDPDEMKEEVNGYEY